MAKQKHSLRSITMRDVAKLAGVSLSTVSRVLSQSRSEIPISEATHARVYEAAKALGYYPNVTARSLRTQRTHLIAVMIADISNPFYHYITRTIQDIASQYNYDVLISNTDHIEEYELRFCEAIMRRPVDGIIMVPFHLTDAHINALFQRTGAAIAVLSNNIEHPNVDTVSADDEQATYDAVRWLVETRQHRKIGFLGASPLFPVSMRRQRGYETALQAAEISVNRAWIRTGDFTYDSGYQMMQALLSQPERPTAVFACNDFIALGALNAALDNGLKVPRDLAIIGFDNVPATTFVRPKLTTVAQFPVEIGRALAEALFTRMSSDTLCERRAYSIPCELIVRQST